MASRDSANSLRPFEELGKPIVRLKLIAMFMEFRKAVSRDPASTGWFRSEQTLSRQLHIPSFSVLLFAYLLVVGCSRTDSKISFSAHSKAAIPVSARLVHSGGQYAGFDASYGFVFEVSDNKLQDHLVDEWRLTNSPVCHSPFFKFANHAWWPPDDAFLKMDEHYGYSDEQKEEYWHIWHDRTHGKLYVEHGRW